MRPVYMTGNEKFKIHVGTKGARFVNVDAEVYINSQTVIFLNLEELEFLVEKIKELREAESISDSERSKDV